jgi:hypothetical protein
VRASGQTSFEQQRYGARLCRCGVRYELTP